MGVIQVPFGNALVTRFEPLGSPLAYKTYQMRRPLATHWRQGTCEEADCEAFLYGWVTHVDVSTELGRRQFDYCRQDRTRSWTWSQEGLIYSFTYPPGTRCFTRHQVPLEREPVFVVRDGDWRGNPTGRRQALSAENWVDDFRGHEDRLATQRERG